MKTIATNASNKPPKYRFACLITLCLVGSGQAYGFGWKEKVTVHPEIGANTVATYEMSADLIYNIDSECADEGRFVKLRVVAEPNASEKQIKKHIPPHPSIPEETHPVEVDVTFDHEVVTNPWPAEVYTSGNGTKTFTVTFKHQSFYTRKIERLLKSASYLNFRVAGETASEVFTSSVPLIRLKGVLEKAIQCPR